MTVEQSNTDNEKNNYPPTTTILNRLPRSMKGSVKICEKCKYTTTHSGHFNVHKVEGCTSVGVTKDRNCPVCCQLYTYNQLRCHLRQYLKKSSHAKNGHENFTPSEHIQMLRTITVKMKQERKKIKS